MLINSAGKLFCSACWEELSLKLSIVKSHVESAKHSRHKRQLEEKKGREQDIAQAFLMLLQISTHFNGGKLTLLTSLTGHLQLEMFCWFNPLLLQQNVFFRSSKQPSDHSRTQLSMTTSKHHSCCIIIVNSFIVVFISFMLDKHNF